MRNLRAALAAVATVAAIAPTAASARLHLDAAVTANTSCQGAGAPNLTVLLGHPFKHHRSAASGARLAQRNLPRNPRVRIHHHVYDLTLKQTTGDENEVLYEFDSIPISKHLGHKFEGRQARVSYRPATAHHRHHENTKVTGYGGNCL